MSSTLIIELPDGTDEVTYDVDLNTVSGGPIQWEIRGATGGYLVDDFIVSRGDTNNYILRPFDLPCSQPCTHFWIGSVIFAILTIFMFVWVCSYIKNYQEIEMFDPTKISHKNRPSTFYANIKYPPTQQEKDIAQRKADADLSDMMEKAGSDTF